MITIELDPQVKDRLKIAAVGFENITCREFDPRLWEALEKLAAEYREKFSSPTEALELLKPARQLYHNFRMEPTRYRPSSEALFRRAVKGKSFYQINTLVDACNYCSLKFLLPIGLYDLDKLSGEKIILRLGKKGESYEGIRKDAIHLEGRLTLADDQGPFGNPSADSLRTAVDLPTGRALYVIFAPETYPDARMQEHADELEKIVLEVHPEARVIFKIFLPKAT